MDTPIPNPDHPITIAADPGRVRVLFQGHVIADSAKVLTLKEAGYHAVRYFPREDVDMAYMSRTERTTHCPHKGDANYYTVMMDGHIAENAVWTYEHPFPVLDSIRDRLAFFPNQVEMQQYTDDRDDSVDAIVQHTDEGDGKTQRTPWRPNVSEPTTSG